jgi:hypothetical protein
MELYSTISPSLNVSIPLINNLFCVSIMPNLDPWINQNSNSEDMNTNTINKFENHLLSIKDERQTMIHPNSHPIYNERQQKIIEMIDWTLDKYKIAVNIQKMNEQVIIDNIIEELVKKREIAINKKEKTLLKDEMLKYSEEEDTIDYVLFRIRELTGRLI